MRTGGVAVAMSIMFALLLTILFQTTNRQAEAAPTTAQDVTQAVTFPMTGTQWVPPSPAYRVVVMEDGIVQLSQAALSTAGLPVGTLDPRTFRMFYMGQEIPLHVQGEGDGKFDSADYVRFYGRTIDSLFYASLLSDNKYTGENVYWLTYGGSNGLRMTTKEGAGSGTAASSFVNSLHQEKNFWYFTDRPLHIGTPMPARFEPGADRWFGDWLKASGTVPNRNNPYKRNYTFLLQNIPTCTVANPAACPPTGLFTAKFQGTYGKSRFSDPDDFHHVRVLINNTEIFSSTQAGKNYEAFNVSAPLPQHALLNGFNNITFELWNSDGNPYDEIYLNWYRVDYRDTFVAENDRLLFNGEPGNGPWRYTVTSLGGGAGYTANEYAYDVTDIFAPQRISNPTVNGSFAVSFADSAKGRRYSVVGPTGGIAPTRIEAVTYPTSAYTPANLLSTANAADWIMISHKDFWSDALRLSQYRAKKYRVALIDVQQIYDQFNGGMRSSESIREFLRYAYGKWKRPAPKFVVFMGDGNNDMRNYRYSEPTYIPPFLIVADPTLGETAADNQFVTLVGNDLLPDISIGRFPVSTPLEAATVVSKTISYETTPFYDDWNTNVVLISDNLEGGGGNFYEFSEILAEGYADPLKTPESKFLPDPYRAIKIYLENATPAFPGCSVAGCHQDIIDAINQGALFTSYIGHAVKTSWASEPLVDGTIVSQFTNSKRLSIFLAMACFEGFFHEADGTVPLAEQYILSPNGAVASWSPTGFGVATGHDYLEQGLFLAVFQNGVKTLGEATDAGKQYLHDHAPAGKYDDLLDTFVVFGDPALQIQTWLSPTAVDMAGFGVTAVESTSQVTWSTASELDIWGFTLLRAETEDGPFVPVMAEPSLAQSPGIANAHTYHFVDVLPDAARPYWYRLEVHKLSGGSELYGLAGTQAAPTGQKIYLPSLQN